MLVDDAGKDLSNMKDISNKLYTPFSIKDANFRTLIHLST